MKNNGPTISSAGVDRIVRSVGKAHCPTDLDRAALMRGINECIELYDAALKFHNDKHEMSERRYLKLVLGRAKRLRQLMKDDAVWHDDKWQYLAKRVSPAQTPRLAIQALEELIARELATREYDYKDKETPYRHSFQARSPFEAMFGDWLPILYTELGFPKGGLASKGGPFIRFARAVASELNIKKGNRQYAVDSFIKALKSVAGGKVRRRLPRTLAEVEYYAEFHRDGLRGVLKRVEPAARKADGQNTIKK